MLHENSTIRKKRSKKTENNKINKEQDPLDHTLLFYFHNNPSAKRNHRKIMQKISKIKENDSFKKTMKTLSCKYFNTEIKLKKSEEIKKFYYGNVNFSNPLIKASSGEENENFYFKSKFTYKNHTKPVLDTFFSEYIPGLFFSTGWDGKIFLNNTSLPLIPIFKNTQKFNKICLKNKELKFFKGHSKGIIKLYESFANKWTIFSFSYDNFIKEWDVDYGKILGRYKINGNIITTCKNEENIFYISENKKKHFFNFFDKNSTSTKFSQLNIEIEKIIKIDPNTFLILNNKGHTCLFDKRNEKTADLEFQAENIFSGENKIFLTKNNQTIFINSSDLKTNKKVTRFDILNNKTTHLLKEKGNKIITYNSKEFIFYQNYEKIKNLEENQLITSFDYQNNSFVYTSLDGKTFLLQ